MPEWDEDECISDDADEVAEKEREIGDVTLREDELNDEYRRRNGWKVSLGYRSF